MWTDRYNLRSAFNSLLFKVCSEDWKHLQVHQRYKLTSLPTPYTPTESEFAFKKIPGDRCAH